MEKLSVFGGTGFVGGEFCRSTQREFTLIPRDQRDPKSRETLYFISTTHNYHIFDDLQKDVEVNLRVLLEVLENFRLHPERAKAHTFNFISSWFVYGETSLPAKETSPCDPKGFYSITKRTAEQLLISFCETFGMKYRILRLCNIYGPGDGGVSKQKNALQFLVQQLKAGEDVKLYYDGHFYREYMHVSDAARAIDLVLRTGAANEVFNIGCGEKILFRDLIMKAKKLTDSKSKIGTMDPPPFHKVVQVKDFYMNTDKLKALGFKPEVSLDEGLEQLCL